MKSLKLVISAAIGCMSVVLLSGSARADVIIDYCEEVDQNVTTTASEMADASADLVDCVDELDECMHGRGLFDEPSRCIKN